MNTFNKKIILSKFPQGAISRDIFKLFESRLLPVPLKNEVLCKILTLSIDPALFARLRNDDNYAPKAKEGDVMPCYGIAQIVESNSNRFKKGNMIFGLTGIQQYCVLHESEIRKINPYLFPYSLNLSIFGIAGITAYFGLFDILKIKKGETLVVSAAVGSVGSIVCQLAKIKGCRTVAITSSKEKMKYAIEQLGCHAAVSYHSPTFPSDLKDACPNGIDAYFDNIGGDIPNYLLPLYNTHARIALCGRMALQHLDSEQEDIGIRDHTSLVRKRIRKEGFVIIDYSHRYSEATLQLLAWYKKGLLKIAENKSSGIETCPDALLGLLESKNIGKQLVEVAHPDIHFNKSEYFAAKIINSKIFPTQLVASILRRIHKKN